jgi:glycosyltransferase involved in cell wall biosynthesis
MEKKKVLLVITKANWGGAQRYVFDLATHLPQDIFDVGVVYGTPGLLSEKLKQAGTAVYQSESLGRDVSFFKDIKSFFELRRLFSQMLPDTVHLNSSKAGGVGALAARIAGVKNIIFTVHGWPQFEPRGPVSKALIWLASWLTALLSHKVICISDYDLSVAKKMPFVGKKVVRIYNGIDVNTQFGTGEQIRAAFPAGVRITGTIGELNKNKNQIALLEQALNDPTVHVAIVGEGESKKMLEETIVKNRLTGRVKLFGFVPAVEVLKGFDVFALPSLKEGLPYVLLEARLAGIPIEANRIGGIGEILDAPDITQFSLDKMVTQTMALY